jgi:putative acyl-CoA dehydrogenase
MTPVAVEAMECLGGNGYVEESPLARLYREAPLNGIWEGSANVICLDALRAITKSAGAFAALTDEIAAGADPRTRSLADWAAGKLADPLTAEPDARAIVEALAVCIQAALMQRHSDAPAAEAFCASRVEECSRSGAFGAVASSADAGKILERVAPR